MNIHIFGGILLFFNILVLNFAEKKLRLSRLSDMYYDDVENSGQMEFNNENPTPNSDIELQYDEVLQPIFNMTDLLEKPQLSGMYDESWPPQDLVMNDENWEDFDNITRRQCQKCRCGSRIYNRIVGGTETNTEEFPWMVMLTYKGRFICGASVINDRYILTAAHCTQGLAAKDLACRFVESRKNAPFATRAVFRGVQSYVRSRRYNPWTMDSDISVIKLKSKINFSNKIRPICLPSSQKKIQNKKAVVSGWGAVKSSGLSSEKLLKVSVPIMSSTQCRNTLYGRQITRNMICAGKTGKDACQGDSGGPLVSYDRANGKFEQIGIVSWGTGCAWRDRPGVYTKVTNFINWIRDKVEMGCWCDED